MEGIIDEVNFNTIIVAQESHCDELLNFIQKNNLDFICYTNLIECGYTYEKLKYIDKEDLSVIFPNREQTALRSEFRAKLFQWKASEGIAISIDNSQSSTLSWPQSTSSFSCPESGCSSSSSIAKEASEILQSSEIGKEIIKQFAVNKFLTEENRRKIVQIISEHFYVPATASYSTLKLSEIERLAEEIVEIFPTESKDVYFVGRRNGTRSNPSGILFNKLHNHHRKRKFVSESKNSPTDEDEEQPPINSVTLDYVNKLKFYTGSEENSLELWKVTHLYRKQFIKNTASFESIIEEFPLYKQAIGYKFIEADFEDLYPGKQFMITSKWSETLPKLTVYYEKNVKDKYYRNILTPTKGVIDSDSKDCIFFILLHTILKPTHRYIVKEGELKLHRKATIQNSVNSSVLHITTLNDLQHQIELRRNKYIESKSPIQPFLIVVGSDLMSLTEFYVSFGNHKFKFSSFILALDICFKIFQVFSLKYPEESNQIWTFLQYYFYDISTPYDLKKPCVTNFMNNLSNCI